MELKPTQSTDDEIRIIKESTMTHKQCPFCGHEEQLFRYDDPDTDECYVQCANPNCCASTQTKDNEVLALAAWNTRHQDPSRVSVDRNKLQTVRKIDITKPDGSQHTMYGQERIRIYLTESGE